MSHPIPTRTYECETCLNEEEPHQCQDCNTEISDKECKEYGGMCYQCMWLLDK